MKWRPDHYIDITTSSGFSILVSLVVDCPFKTAAIEANKAILKAMKESKSDVME